MFHFHFNPVSLWSKWSLHFLNSTCGIPCKLNFAKHSIVYAKLCMYAISLDRRLKQDLFLGSCPVSPAISLVFEQWRRTFVPFVFWQTNTNGRLLLSDCEASFYQTATPTFIRPWRLCFIRPRRLLLSDPASIAHSVYCFQPLNSFSLHRSPFCV